MSALLQYTIDLKAAGLEDDKTLRRDLSLSSLHQRLKERVDAWDNLQWKQQEDIPIMFGPWEFLAGTLVTSQPDYSARTTKFFFKQPPSYYSEVPSKSWTVNLENIRVHDFAIDPSQDLLVVAEDILHLPARPCDLHVLSMSTGKPHPLAASPLIKYCQLAPPFNVEMIKFQIQESLVGVLFADHSGRGELALWNWKTGNLCKRIRGPIFAFAFLTSEFLFFAAVSTRILDEVPTLNIVKLEPDCLETVEEDVLNANYVCALEYPPIDNPGHIYIHMEIRTDPPPLFPPPALFRTSDSDRLFVINYVTVHWSLLLVVPLSTFLAQITQCQSLIHTGWTARRTFTFNDWGSTGSRMFNIRPSDIWICYVHGMKLSILDEDMRTMKIYDFNPFARRRDLMSSHCNTTPVTELEEEADPADLAPDIFTTRVTTSLPFRTISVPAPLPQDQDGAEALMIGETSLVLVLPLDEQVVFRILSF